MSGVTDGAARSSPAAAWALMPAPQLLRTLEFLPRCTREAVLDSSPGCAEEVAVFLVIDLLRSMGGGGASAASPVLVPWSAALATSHFETELVGYLHDRRIVPRQLLQDGGAPLRALLEQHFGPTSVWLPSLGSAHAWIAELLLKTLSPGNVTVQRLRFGFADAVVMGPATAAQMEALGETCRAPPPRAEDEDAVHDVLIVDELNGDSPPPTEVDPQSQLTSQTMIIRNEALRQSIHLVQCHGRPPEATTVYLRSSIPLAALDTRFLQASLQIVDLSGVSASRVGDNFLSESPALHTLVAPGKCKLGVVGDGFLESCPSLTCVDLSNMGVTAIGASCLKDCAALEAIDLGGMTLVSVGDDFLARTALMSLIASQPCRIDAVGKNFCAQTDLSDVDLSPFSLGTVGSGFLSACGSLRRVVLGPGGVASLGDYCFSACPRLESIVASARGESSIDAIGDYFATDRAGGGCPALSHVDLGRIKVSQKIGNAFLWGCTALREIDLGGVHVSAVGHRFLSNCSQLTDVTVSGEGCSLGEVGSHFASAYNGAGCPRLNRLDLDKLGLSRMGDAFLAACESVTAIDFGGLTLAKVGNGCLSECKNLTSLVASRPCDLGDVGSNFCCRAASLTAVDLVNFQMNQIGDNFLAHSPALRSVDLGRIHVKSVGDYFLAACPLLESITARHGCHLGSVGAHFGAALQRGFTGQSKLSLVDLPHMGIEGSIGPYFLWKCSALTALDLSGVNVTQTGSYFLADCGGLVQLQAPGGCRLGDVGTYFASPFNTKSGPRPVGINFADINISTIDDIFVSLCPDLVDQFLASKEAPPQ